MWTTSWMTFNLSVILETLLGLDATSFCFLLIIPFVKNARSQWVIAKDIGFYWSNWINLKSASNQMIKISMEKCARSKICIESVIEVHVRLRISILITRAKTNVTNSELLIWASIKIIYVLFESREVIVIRPISVAKMWRNIEFTSIVLIVVFCSFNSK